MTDTAPAARSLASVIADALAFKAAEFDDWRFYAVPGLTSEGDSEAHIRGPFETREEAQAECAAFLERGLFDYANVREEEEGRDLSVSGADVVDFFAQLRLDLRAARADVNADLREAVQNMRDLIQEAMDHHIYDTDDVIEEGCGYTAAVDHADDLLAITEAGAVSPPLPGSLDVIRDLMGAVSALDTEVCQMKDMFPDEDGAIQNAINDGEEAFGRGDLYLKAVRTDGPVRIAVFVQGGNVQSVTTSQALPGVELFVIDADVTDEDEAIYEVTDNVGATYTARVDAFDLEVAPFPEHTEASGQSA